MKKIQVVYGLGRTRNKHGAIVKRYINPYVNTIHSLVGGGFQTMQVLIVEVYEKT